MENYLIGSDPEIFLKDMRGEIASAIGLFKGTKEKPRNIGNNCSVQEDNILVEFNIPPAKSMAAFLDSINYAKTYIETILIPLDLKLHYSSSERVNESVLKKDEQAMLFGCSPSYNVVSNGMSIANIDFLTESEKLIRSSGFHIHIGYDNPNEEFSARLVLCFELFVTLSLLHLDHDLYNRRLLYGLIGDCRMKSYGVECRSLGGYFLKNDESIKKVWRGVKRAIKFAETSRLETSVIRDMVLECLDFEFNPVPSKVEEVLNRINIKQLV